MYSSPLAWSIDLKNLDFSALNGQQIPVPQEQVALPLLK
jgi:choloylglycine hydrolase